MATEAPAMPTASSAAAAPAPAATKHLLIPGSAMARLAARAEAMRPSRWYTAWELAILQPSQETFEGLAANAAAHPVRALKWVAAGAALGWGFPAMASLLRTSAGLFTVVTAYAGLVLLTVITFVAATLAAHALADQLEAQGDYGRWAFACAAFAAPLTLAAGLLVSGPAPLRLLLLPTAIYALALAAQAARAVYGLTWRWALLVAGASVLLLALLPLAAVAGAWAGLVGW